MIKSKKIFAAIMICTSFFFACKSAPDDSTANSLVDTSNLDNDNDTDSSSTETTEDTNTSSKANIQDYLNNIEESRKAAIDAGADKDFANAFNAADSEYAKIKKATLEGKENTFSEDELKDLDMRYKALATLEEAKAKKERIDTLGFASYDQKTYDTSSETLDKLSSNDIGNLSGSDFYKQAEQTDAGFKKVLNTAFTKLASEERSKAFKAKQQADSVKAYVSRTEDYNKAVSDYKTGDTRRATDPETAYNSYKSANEKFTTLYDEISVARAEAQRRIEEAKARVAQSQANAQQADEDSPLGEEEVEGIEEEDTSLLEEDDFSEDQTQAEVEDIGEQGEVQDEQIEEKSESPKTEAEEEL